MPFLLIFFLFSLLEISVFIFVGGEIGLLPTLLITFLTAIIGGSIVKYQGLHTLHDMQTNMRGGTLPVKEIFDGFCLIAAGAFLITPGLVTDTLGFLLLVPAVREALREHIKNSKHFKFSGSAGFQHGPHGADPFRRDNDSGVIEGEYERVEDEDRLK